MRRSAASTRILTGHKDLDRRLQLIALAPANRSARAGLLKGSRLAARLIKKEIPTRYKGARAAIGARVKQAKGGVTTAKAGANVGNKKQPKLPPKRSTKAGIGIRAANLHWLLLGTAERWHEPAAATNSAGQEVDRHYTGKMPQLPAVKRAMSGGRAQVTAAIREGTSKQFLRELQQLSRKRKAARKKAARG